MKRSISILILFLFALLIGAEKPALISGQGTVPDYQFQAIWGLPLEQDGLLRPTSITQGDNGDIYLVDEGRNQIMV
ncbi:MAG TPA: hypothetical protein ENK60_01250, partial [Anaerolineae bacterium]|nr:hypothetical protein [Anaerolineae bacterium]